MAAGIPGGRPELRARRIVMAPKRDRLTLPRSSARRGAGAKVAQD